MNLSYAETVTAQNPHPGMYLDGDTLVIQSDSCPTFGHYANLILNELKTRHAQFLQSVLFDCSGMAVLTTSHFRLFVDVANLLSDRHIQLIILDPSQDFYQLAAPFLANAVWIESLTGKRGNGVNHTG